MRKKVISGILFILSIFLISMVSAEVWFTFQPESLYNMGDELEISLSVSEIGKQLEVRLDCQNQTKLIFLKYIDNETDINILQPLTKNFLDEIQGDCKITGKYGEDNEDSSGFRISGGISLKIEIDNFNYFPGEEVRIKGEAKKANTQLLDGFFEVSFPRVKINITGEVKGGKFERNITLPEDMDSGGYLINVAVYEKKEDEIINSGDTRKSIYVKPLPTRVDIALDSQNVQPGENLSLRVMLYDQTEKLVEGEASFLIEDAEGTSLIKVLTKVNEPESFFIEKNLSVGYYKIKAYSAGIYGERQFYTEENEEAEFKIINNTLIVRNIGNIDYKKAIQVKIDNIVEIINDEIEVGMGKKYELRAPKGEYDIIITDGEKLVAGEGIILTGKTISVKEMGKGFFSRNKSLAWIFLILVMGMFIFVSSRRILKKKFVLSDKSSGKIPFKKGMKGKGVIKVGEEKVKIVKDLKEAEHSLVLKGQKQETILVCLKIKNEISKLGRQNVEKILEKAHDGKAVIYKSGDYRLVIFSPLITRTYKNYVPAVKLALDMSKALREYNSKTQDKINFGISVHSGNMVNKLEENKLKFTSLGNSVNLAKKISGLSEKNVLLSKEIHEKTISDIKTEKQEKRGLEVFTVDGVMDTKRNRIFVQDFLKKMAEEGKKK